MPNPMKIVKNKILNNSSWQVSNMVAIFLISVAKYVMAISNKDKFNENKFSNRL